MYILFGAAGSILILALVHYYYELRYKILTVKQENVLLEQNLEQLKNFSAYRDMLLNESSKQMIAVFKENEALRAALKVSVQPNVEKKIDKNNLH